MDYIIAIKGEIAYICKEPVVDDALEVSNRLEAEGAPDIEPALAFKRGDIVVDEEKNTHQVADIHVPLDSNNSTDWYITNDKGEKVLLESLRGVLIKEVPKYHVEGLLS